MTWSANDPQGLESDKIAPHCVHYLQGRALDIGCGVRKVWPKLIGIDDGSAFAASTAADIRCSAVDLSMFQSGAFDAVFSSHLLEDLERERVPQVLAEWGRLLKVGGYLVLYVPSANLYPKCGEEWANPKHRWDIYPGDIEAILREMAEGGECGWELVESEERGEDNEYSLFVVARKMESGWSENVWQRNPGGKKRCLVIRYGAIGDAIVTSSVLPGLKKQGWHVTVNCKPATYQILKHDPHIDDWVLQDTDFVPNMALGPYWHSLATRYDKVVNLCESVETTLLAVPGHLRHAYSDEARRAIFGGTNYLERTHEIADLPYEPRQKFYASAEETAAALAARHGKRPAVLVALNGSAPHKVYPHISVVLAWLFEHTPCHVWLTGDADVGGKIQEATVAALAKSGYTDLSRLHQMAGKWAIREALAFAQVADCVVGPETGVLNAVAFEPMRKVVYLSHSSHTNLTRDWVNTVALEPAGVACFPCHRLHWGWDFCHQDPETKAAACASAILPERVFGEIVKALVMREAA
jgi:ADP-heptose:LPS heptosyltransferase/predicted SAM-dependent methyltransferase